MKALVVDDEKNMREFLEFFLSHDAGYKVESAENPIQALEILKERSFKVIVTDHDMPHMNGTDFIENILRLGIETERIIILSGLLEIPSKLSELIQQNKKIYFVNKGGSAHRELKRILLEL